MPVAVDTLVRINPDNAEVYLPSVFDRFEAAYDAAPFKQGFDIGGGRIEVACHSRDYAQLAHAALAGGHDLPGGQPGPTCRIVAAAAGTHGMPRLAWSQRYYQERLTEAKLAPTRYRLHYHMDHGFWQVYDRETGRGMQLHGGPRGYPDWEPGSPLRNFLHWHFVGRDRCLVHAGTLAVGSIGVMLCGAGGSGKSGTVLAGLAHGLGSVGDDYVLVESTERVTARPLFSTLKQDPEGLARLGLTPGDLGAAPLNWQGKHQFTIPDLAPTQPEALLQIGAILMPQITGGTSTTFHPASAKEAFLSLTPSGVTQMPGDRDANFAFCARLTRRLPAYRVRLGTEPAEIAASLRRFIEGQVIEGQFIEGSQT